MIEALAWVEIASVPTGLAALDALAKRARTDVLGSNVVEPGLFLLCFGGVLGEVEEACAAAVERGGTQVRDWVLLPAVHPDLVAAVTGARIVDGEAEAVGIIEGATIASTALAADRSVKDAAVALVGFRVTPGMGGRAYYAVTGTLHDVESAVAAGAASLGKRLQRGEVIGRPSGALLAALLEPGVFAAKVR